MPSLAGHEGVIGADYCHYVASALYDKRGDNDELGTLYLTSTKAIFVGDTRVQLPWSKVDSVRTEDGNGLAIQRDFQTPHYFCLDSEADALLAEFIARHCMASAAWATTGSRGWRDEPETLDVAARVSIPNPRPHGFVNVVGEANYQAALRSLASTLDNDGIESHPFTARLVPEPNNIHDSNAVAVKTEGDAIIGYLPRAIAKSYQRHLLTQPEIVTCPAKLCGLAERSIGVVLDFSSVRLIKGGGKAADPA